MVLTLIDHKNGVVKCAKLNWNHEPDDSFYALFYVVFLDHEKNVVDFFDTITLKFLIKYVICLIYVHVTLLSGYVPSSTTAVGQRARIMLFCAFYEVSLLPSGAYLKSAGCINGQRLNFDRDFCYFLSG